MTDSRQTWNLAKYACTKHGLLVGFGIEQPVAIYASLQLKYIYIFRDYTYIDIIRNG